MVSGFGPFGTVRQNPAQFLAEESGFPCQILEVSFDFVDQFVDSVECSRILMLGVAASRSLVSLELSAKNRTGATADVRGSVRSEFIVADGPENISQSLWTPEQFMQWREATDIVESHDAGDYLCNYLYYRMRVCRPEIRAAFLHVVPFEQIPQHRQLEVVRLVASSPGM